MDVVFPAPFGPRKPNTSFCLISKLRSSTIVRFSIFFVRCSVFSAYLFTTALPLAASCVRISRPVYLVKMSSLAFTAASVDVGVSLAFCCSVRGRRRFASFYGCVCGRQRFASFHCCPWTSAFRAFTAAPWTSARRASRCALRSYLSLQFPDWSLLLLQRLQTV